VKLREASMVAYVVLQIEITDPGKHAKYREIATPIVEKYGGRYLARGGKMEVIEGESLSRIVIVEFPSIKRFKSFYHAPEYQEAKVLRQSATRGNMLVVEGAYSPPPRLPHSK
jgi:uncharacterized protein (DUF1330 family)